nr:winged helix-turn-helix domain-containing protein [Sporohalobacter salinus]
MTISDMAYKILKEHKEPLHYKEIFEKISKVKQIKNSGSVQSCIYSEDKFIRMGEGYWGLTEWLLSGLRFIYSIKPLEYQRRTLKIDYDHELYFPYYIQNQEIDIEFKDRKYTGIRKDKQTFELEDFYNNEPINPRDKLIIKISDVNKLNYEIVDLKPKNIELDNLNQRIADLAFKVLEKKRGIMSTTRILEQILIRLLKTGEISSTGEFDLKPLLPLSKILNADGRFNERLAGMFTLNI